MFYFRLNIFSILLVTIKPPTTFMVAKITATNPKYDPIPPPIFVEIIAPTIAIPDIAFDPLIKGVCRVGGTFVIISKPIKMARMKTVIMFMSIRNPLID